MYRCKHFKLYELVSPLVYHKYKDFAWNFLNEELLQDLDYLREQWGKPLIINNWYRGGSYKESGFRCNMDSIVKAKKDVYCSCHLYGRAYDIKPVNISDVSNLYLCVIDNYDKFLTLSRIENIDKTPTWVHIDNMINKQYHITIF